MSTFMIEHRESVSPFNISTLITVAVVLAFITVPAFAGTGGDELSGIYDWFVGLIEGTGGRLIAVLALLGALAITAVSYKVGGVGGLLFVVLGAAFGTAFINSIITATV